MYAITFRENGTLIETGIDTLNDAEMIVHYMEIADMLDNTYEEDSYEIAKLKSINGNTYWESAE